MPHDSALQIRHSGRYRNVIGPELMSGMTGIEPQRGDGVLQGNCFGRKRRIRNNSYKARLYHRTSRPPFGSLARKPILYSIVKLMVRPRESQQYVHVEEVGLHCPADFRPAALASTSS